MRIYRLPDTQMPLMMLNLLALAYVNQPLENSMSYLHAVHCAALERLGEVTPEEDEGPGALSWDAIATSFAYWFRVGEAGWQLFMGKLELDPDHFLPGNYQGCMLQLAREA